MQKDLELRREGRGSVTVLGLLTKESGLGRKEMRPGKMTTKNT